jgi:hypothetical protein
LKLTLILFQIHARGVRHDEVAVVAHSVEWKKGVRCGTMLVASLAMAAMATACTVASLYGGEKRPRIVVVGVAGRGRSGGVFHLAHD